MIPVVESRPDRVPRPYWTFLREEVSERYTDAGQVQRCEQQINEMKDAGWLGWMILEGSIINIAC